MTKYDRIIESTWEYLENNFKGSEITLELWIKAIEKECDTSNCLKKCIKLMWQNYEFYEYRVYDYYKKYIKNNYGVIVK